MTRPTITTHPLAVTGTGHLTELLYDDGENDGVITCAAHGGRVEPGTAEVAMELATRFRSATCWARLGYEYDEEASEFERWHPPSTGIDPGEHRLLPEVADRGFETVVSFHGLADEELLVGGGIDPVTKELVADRLDRTVDADVRTVSDGEYAGVHPDNFVNWLAADGGGLQLEQGPAVRADESGAVVDVLADLIRDGRL